MYQEETTKDLEEIKNRQLAIKNEGINSRITEAKEQISELEYRMVEITETEQNREKQSPILYISKENTPIYILVKLKNK